MFSDPAFYADEESEEIEGERPSAAYRLFHWICCCGCITYCVTSLQSWQQRTARDRKKRSIRVIRDDPEDSAAEERSLLGRTPSLTSSGCSSSSSRDLKADLYTQIERRRSAGPVRPLSCGGQVPFWPGAPPTPPAVGTPRTHGLQPQLYEVTEEAASAGPQPPDLGQLQFSLAYRPQQGALLVRVLEARDLVAPALRDSADLAHSNPYVRVWLAPGPRRCRQTRVRRRTQNPRFDETFSFDVSVAELERVRLHLLVKDFDKFSRQCVIGEVTLPLAQLHGICGQLLWRPLAPCVQYEEDCGDILLTMNYLPRAGRLNVDVVRCRHLPAVDLNGRTDPCVRVSLVLGEKHIKTKRTTCHKMTTDPVFNERISFSVMPAEVSEVTLVLSVWDVRATAVRQEPIARLAFGRHSTGPEEVAHWSHMIRAHRSAGTQWHRLKTYTFCHKVSPASRIVP
ncbi:synaptotagmin-17-like [Amphibalanus amphitrite]|uniref:synaptotagmin-17-like n=1 Tax=Amphibalanus amphitrite TaxID=1232801 RepID=UPI001C9165EF|nr:synaptotagmin-17-like [Amphibalanus amphitrite]